MIRSTRSWLPAVAFAVLSVSAIACGGADESAPSTQNQDVTVAAGRFETFEGSDGQYYFHLLAANGQKVLQSEGYKTLASAKKGVASVRTNGVDDAMYSLRTAKTGESYFDLLALNGQIIATSEIYSSKSNAQKGINTAVKLVGLSQQELAAETGGAHFDSFKGLDGKHYFHLRAKNGEILLQSEGYTSTSGVTTGIASLRENGKNAASYEVLPSADNQYFVHVLAENSEIIASGETYVTKEGATKAVAEMSALLKSGLVADPK